MDEPSSFIFEKEYFKQLAIVHKTCILFYRRTENVRVICRQCVPEFCEVRPANETKQVSRILLSRHTQQSSSYHHKVSMIVAEVDHTLVKLMEVIHKYNETESLSSARLPLLLLMPPSIENDTKQYLQTCQDVYNLMEYPYSAKDVFATIVVMLHRRNAAQEVFNKVLKSNYVAKNPRETVFLEKKSSREDEMTVSSSRSPLFSSIDTSMSLMEEVDAEELDQEILDLTAPVTVDSFLESSKLILPKDIFRMRQYYVKEAEKNNSFDAFATYRVDPRERERVDRMILKNLNNGIAFSNILDADMNVHYETLPLETSAEFKEVEVSGVVSEKIVNDKLYPSEWVNILSESTRPSHKFIEGSQSYTPELLPFVDRPRPNMSKPKTISGLSKKNAVACWKVMTARDKLLKEAASQHWSAPDKATAATLKQVTDEHGTMTLEIFLKIKDQIAKQDSDNVKIMEIAVPVDAPWQRPVQSKWVVEHKKDSFGRDLAKTKQVLSKKGLSAPSIDRKPLNKSPSLFAREDSSLASAGTEKESLSDDRDSALSVARDWRGVSEQHADGEGTIGTPPKLVKKQLSTILRSVSGVNFGNIIVGAKARDKAKQMMSTMALSAHHDETTSRLIMVNLESRRVSAQDRDNLAGGISCLLSEKLEDSVKCFSKAIMVCKQVHIAMIFRGIVNYRRGKFFLALEDFTNALKNIESSNITIKNHMEDILIARFNRGMTFFRLGEDTSGLLDLKFALAVNPSNSHVRSALMQAQRRASHYIEAVEHCVVLKEEAQALAAASQPINRSNSNTDEHKANGTDANRSPIPSPKNNNGGRKTLRRVFNNAVSGESFSEFGSPLTSALDVSRVKLIDVVIKEPETSFPSLAERKIEFMSQKKTEETSAQNSMYLENFKHANGFKRHMFDTHFICLSELQEALLQPPETRTEQSKNFIMGYLKNYAIFCDIDEKLLFEVAGAVEYRAIRNQSIVFFQGDPVDAVVLVLSGLLHLRLDHGGKAGAFSTVVAELGKYEMYDSFASIFHSDNTNFLQKINQICLDGENGQHHDFSPNYLSDEKYNENASQELASISELPRALQPGTFMTCKVASPSELILLKQVDFDRLLRHQTEIEFFRRLEVLKASGVFSNGAISYFDLVRLGRMCVLRRFHEGEVILSQGEVPNFMYFVLRGSCKALKRPDPTEYLCQRLKDLRDKVDNYDEKYTFHHRQRNVMTAAAETTRVHGHVTAIEMERINLKAEIARLEILEAKETIAEKKRRQEEKELATLGHKVRDRFVEITTLHWPQIFGEAAILQPDSGMSAGTIVAESNCHLLCLHKAHLQTFVISKKIMENVRVRGVVYPSHEKLILELAEKEKWVSFKNEALDEISKNKWPGFQKEKKEHFYV